jgi:hypothetical protein
VRGSERSHEGRGSCRHGGNINSFVYAVDPVRFGAQAYRHYLKPGIGRSFLASLLNGQVVLDVEPR